jgi:hypothetical protein
MRWKTVAAVLAFAGALALLAAPADAAPKKKRVIYNQDRTVVVTRDEHGRVHTKIFVQKRSYLDPGTEGFPGERGYYDYAELPTGHAGSVLDGTIFGTSMQPLPGAFTLPLRDNPWIGY